MFQVFILRFKIGRHRKVGQQDIPFKIEQFNLIYDFIGIIDGFRQIMKDLVISSVFLK